ncbi:tetratricopeptide repeat protein [uncultured Erythrobacter sp.]|uniref:tetratricopeptide repeat protein n=1 Tax=uncultured Erythrobacter sp. TaxID=263913 RepID=UPI0026206A9F|nr:tetratricopeptide repeat protein [uncultured Erythrobacter sp.]
MSKRLALVSALALLAAGCSSDPAPASSTQLTGSDAFMDAVEEARRHVRWGDLAAAGQSYDQALEIEPENPGLWVDIARLRFLGGEQLSAIAAADYALQLGPSYAPALLLRAQMVRDANGLEEALPWFESAASIDPNNPEILGEYAATLGDLGYNRDMLLAVRDLAELAPDEPQAFYLQAVLAARADNPGLAARLLERSRYVENGVPAARMLLAMINMQQGNYDTAANTLEALADEQPANVRVQELLAQAWWQGGRDSQIADRFEEIAGQPSASSYLTMLVGRALERMGGRETAIPYLERASQLDSQTIYVLSEDEALPAATNRLRNLVAAQNLSVARSVSNQTLREFPQSGDAFSLVGDIALAGDNPLRAIEAYQVSAKVRRSWPLTRKLIAAMLEAGESEPAKAVASRYLRGDPLNLDAMIVLARLSAEESDWLRVQVLLDTAIAQGAGSDPAVLALRAKAAHELGNESDAAQANALLADTLPAPFL